MIKKIFITLLTFVGLGISFSSAIFTSHGYYYTSPVGEFSTNGSYGYSVSRFGNFLTTYDNDFSLSFYWSPVMEGRKNVFNIGWINGDLYFFQYYKNGNTIKSVQGFINNWCITPVSSRGNDSLHNNCSYSHPFSDVKAQAGLFTGYAFEIVGSISPTWAGYDYLPMLFCLSDGEYDYCIRCGIDSAGCPSGLTGSLGFNISDFGYASDINWSDPPFSPGSGNIPDISFDTGGNIGNVNINLDNTIKYYENRFGWDVNMCYVGTDNLSGVWGDNVEFEYGSGLTIYGLYHGLYNSFGSNSIKNVGSFINTWLLNYYGWFSTPDDERLYLANYNGPDTNITLIYTGFTFPFANNPVAIYFMSDLLASDYVAENSQGEEIAYYCELKLNYDLYKNGTKSFEELNSLINPNIRDRIEGYNDVTLGSHSGYSLPNGSGVWSDYSGYAIPSDLSPTSLFKDLYNKIDNLSNGFVPLNSVGIIPWWILYPMIFLILFRILRH